MGRTMDSLRNQAKLQEIQDDLSRSHDKRLQRVYLMLEVGINTGLRISDMVNMRVGDLRGQHSIEVRQQKTGLPVKVAISPELKTVIQKRTAGKTDDDYLFQSRQHRPDGSTKPITTRTAYNDMQTIAKRFCLSENIGTHTMRKTFGYWLYKQSNSNLSLVSMLLGHRDTDVTRRYIGLDAEELELQMRKFKITGHEVTDIPIPADAQKKAQRKTQTNSKKSKPSKNKQQ